MDSTTKCNVNNVWERKLRSGVLSSFASPFQVGGNRWISPDDEKTSGMDCPRRRASRANLCLLNKANVEQQRVRKRRFQGWFRRRVLRQSSRGAIPPLAQHEGAICRRGDIKTVPSLLSPPLSPAFPLVCQLSRYQRRCFEKIKKKLSPERYLRRFDRKVRPFSYYDSITL